MNLGNFGLKKFTLYIIDDYNILHNYYRIDHCNLIYDVNYLRLELQFALNYSEYEYLKKLYDNDNSLTILIEYDKDFKMLYLQDINININSSIHHTKIKLYAHVENMSDIGADDISSDLTSSLISFRRDCKLKEIGI